ncbi:hypothetical protein [Latilactobacillus fuchuensis]|uniref:Uncharacterized protein n=2 Tax=Latilactobacillus fuchuensis TaxID=164393 RepID=A0A0R1RWF3_9LACO|nr:hypothetical protein [Latilactobacillus fuchuensis]KRL61415.1 hypothetical protein FC69_GL000820 [Latilactobacillus fuchuensis DSM 14340 = JCM 11249]
MKKILIIVSGMFLLLTGIGLGGKVYMDNKATKELEYQRESAMSLRNEYTDLEEIIFDKDGGQFSKTENDFGTWYIDVKLKISDNWYEITIGKNGGSYGGVDEDFLEEKTGKKTKNSVKVKYSNGDEAVLK